MKKLAYILILIAFWSCENRKELDDQKYIESFHSLMEQQEEVISNQFYIGEISVNNEANQRLQAFKHQYSNSLTRKIHIDSFYKIAKQLCLQDDFEFSWLTNQDSLYNYLELGTYTQSAKDSLLTKLRLLDCSAQLITKFNQQNDVYFNDEEEFKVFTTLDKKSLKVGESFRLSVDIYTYNKQNIPSFFVDGKEVTSNTFSILATCEDTKPCHKKLHYQIHSFLGKDTIINQTSFYTVLPKP